MKVLCCFSAIVVFASASFWHKKRDNFDDNFDCWKMYQPIIRVMNSPDFSLLLGCDGKLNLDCRNSTFIEASDCELDSRGFPKDMLFNAWNHFCQNKQDVESTPECWSDKLTYRVLSCIFMRPPSTADLEECIVNEVTAMSECGEGIGQLFRELLSIVLKRGS